MHIYMAPLPPIYLTSFMHDLQDLFVFVSAGMSFVAPLPSPQLVKYFVCLNKEDDFQGVLKIFEMSRHLRSYDESEN